MGQGEDACVCAVHHDGEKKERIARGNKGVKEKGKGKRNT
jgi:hypothetical protein